MYNTLDQKILVQMYMTLYCYYYGSISYLTLYKKKKTQKKTPKKKKPGHSLQLLIISRKSKISLKCEFQPIKSLEITLTINLRLTIFCEIDPWCSKYFSATKHYQNRLDLWCLMPLSTIFQLYRDSYYLNYQIKILYIYNRKVKKLAKYGKYQYFF